MVDSFTGAQSGYCDGDFLQQASWSPLLQIFPLAAQLKFVWMKWNKRSFVQTLWNVCHSEFNICYSIFYVSSCIISMYSSCNFFKLFVQIIKVIHWSKKVLPFVSYPSNKSSFFFSLVAPVIYSIAYLGFKYCSFICFGGANISTWYEKRKKSLILHIFSIHTSEINFWSQ